MPSPLDLYLAECLPRGVFPALRDGRLREFSSHAPYRFCSCSA